MNDEAIISQWNIDEHGNPISIKTEQETQVSVGGNLVQLRGIPDEMEGVTIEDKSGNTFFRVENLDEVYDSDYAYYLMKNGNVQFNPSQNGKLLYFKYYSKGVTLLSVSRIYYKDSYDNVVKILEDLIKAGFDALKVLEVFGGAKEVIDRLERDLDNGRALATQLENIIAEGTPLQQNLHADITEAKKWKDSLHKDVAEGKILQPQLHQDIIDGRETDANLTQTINSATELDDKIKTTGNASFIIEVDNWTTSDDSNWAYMYTLTTSLNSSDLVFKTQEITTKGFEDCLLYSVVKNAKRIDFYTDNKVRTKVVVNARQYGGTIQDFSVVNTDLISEGASNKYVTPQEKVNVGTIPDIKQQVELNKSSLEESVTKLNNKSVDVKVDFGAKGDSITDDTQAIRNAVTSGAKEVFFPPGTYIINIESGTDNSQRRFFHCLCDRLRGVEGLSIIKLGSGNGQAETFRNYASIFWFSGDTPNRDVDVRELTFDYNYKNNIPSHYESRYSGVEENSQNNAITGAYIRNLTVTKCTFIDFSGTNCIDYKSNKDNRGVNYVNVYDNNFINCGHKVTYNGLDAYHDCSVIAIHKASLTNPKIDKAKLHSYVKNNNFIGVGGNAFNVCESFADYQVFENNYIEKFAQAYLPLSWDGDTYCSIKDNVLKDVKKAIAIWNGYQKQASIDVRNGFSNLEIDKNTIYINPSYWRKIPLYNKNSESNGVIPHFYTGIHCQVPITSIKNISITNNKIEYENSLLKLDEVNKSYKNGDCINFNGNIPSELVTLLNYTPTIDTFVITGNQFKNSYNGVLHLESYSTVNELFIENNKFINCLMDETLSDKFLVNIELKGETIYSSNPNIVAYIRNLAFKNNYIDTLNLSRYVNLSILSNKYSSDKASETYIDYLNNSYTLLPSQSFINFYSGASAIQNVTFVQHLNDNNAPSSGKWKRGNVLYNANPQAVGFIGWVCTSSGEPGTWKKFGAIDTSI